MISVAICGATMMKTWLFAGCSLGFLARLIVFIVLVMSLTARNRGFTRLRPVAWWSSICACAIAYCLISTLWMWRHTKKGCLWFNPSITTTQTKKRLMKRRINISLVVNSWWPRLQKRWILSFIVLLWVFGSQPAFGTISSMIGSMKEEASSRSLGPARIFQSLHVREPSSLWMHNHRQEWTFQECWTGTSSQVTIVLSYSSKEKELARLKPV